MVEKILWKTVRTRPLAWQHIKSSIAGEKDLLVCSVCQASLEMEKDGRTRQSIYREMARKHFYKHKLWEFTDFELTAPTATEVPLFP